MMTAQKWRMNMFTGYVLKRYPDRVVVLEGIATRGGEFAVKRGNKIVHVGTDRDEAEIIAELITEE
jgi:hypothetical protein